MNDESKIIDERGTPESIEAGEIETTASTDSIEAEATQTDVTQIIPTDATATEATPTEATATDAREEKVEEHDAARHASQTEIIAPEEDKENSAFITGEVRRLSPVMADDAARRAMGERSRRTFIIGGIAALGAYGGWRWLHARPDAEGIPSPFRAAHEFNRGLSETYFSSSRLAPEFPRERAREPRVNGGEGMSEGFNAEAWRLQVVGVRDARSFPQYTDDIAYMTAMDNENSGDDSSQLHENPDAKGAPNERTSDMMEALAAPKTNESGLLLTLDDIKRLPRVEITTELKCIEGWSVIVNWAGARFSDFAKTFQPPTRNGSASDVMSRAEDLVRYVSLVTPDGGYYVGMDMASALHPQTLLCYEMNGEPLNMEHGAPLRLVTPVKYGIKHIKRIGRIEFTDARPADFWAERGYDWYSGH